MKKRIHIKVYGLVQGVGFRASTVYQARKLGVSGYVKNLPRGEVEIVAEGEEDKLNLLLEWSKRGPAGASVKKVEYKLEEFKGEFKNFEIRY